MLSRTTLRKPTTAPSKSSLRYMVEIVSFCSMGFSSNVFIVRGEKTFLVDAGIDTTKSILQHVESEDLELDRIILTHRHYDHTADVEELSKSLNVPIYASEPEAEALRAADDRTIIASAFGRDMNPLDVEILEEDEYAGFRIIQTPGHTDGSISMYHPEERILLSGDTVFPDGGVGRTDLPTGDMEQLVNSVKKLLELDVDSMYPGHGHVVKSDAKNHIERALRFISYL